jgi:hypothetical protein
MRKIIGISAIVLILGTPAAIAQSYAPDVPYATPYETSRGVYHHRYRPAYRRSARARDLVLPRNDPDSTNRQPASPYHEELNNRGEPTGPLSTPGNGE